MRGRNTTVVGIRLPDKIIAMLAERANRQDLSIGEYIKRQIIKSCSVNASVNAIKPTQVYNPSVHKPGDRVLVKRGSRLVEAVVPQVDADGHIIPEE